MVLPPSGHRQIVSTVAVPGTREKQKSQVLQNFGLEFRSKRGEASQRIRQNPIQVQRT
jgi:hypothetical protein